MQIVLRCVLVAALAATVLTEEPETPTGIHCIAGNRTIFASWHASANATLYTVSTGNVSTTTTSETQVAVDGLDDYTDYNVSVVASNGDGDSEPTVCAVSLSSQAAPAEGLMPDFWGTTTASPLADILPVGTEFLTVALGDLTGDEFADLILGTKAFGFYVLQWDVAAGTFISAGSATLDTAADAFLDGAVGDVTGDGANDLVVSDATSEQLHVFEVSSDTGSLVELSGSTNPFDGLAMAEMWSVGLGDIDADGDADAFITVYDTSSGESSLLLSVNTDGVFSSTEDITSVSGHGYGTRVEPCDVDADGDLDLLVSRYATNQWLCPVLYENTGDAFAAAWAYNPDTDPFADSDAADCYSMSVACDAGVGLLLAMDTSSADLRTWWPLVFAPSVPTDVTATLSGDSAQLSWQPPKYGSPVTTYVVSSTDGNELSLSLLGWPTLTANPTITGSQLQWNESTAFTVYGTNEGGVGPVSQSSDAVRYIGLPAAPSGIACITADNALIVRWDTPPQQDNVSHFTVNDTLTTTATSITLTSLRNFEQYEVRVVAENSFGVSSVTNCFGTPLPTPTFVEETVSNLVGSPSPVLDEDKYYDPALGDVNNDGFLDLVISSAYDMELYFGTASGMVASGYDYDYLLPLGRYHAVTLGDLDNDGNADLVIGASTALTFYASDGTGTFVELDLTVDGIDLSDRARPALGDIDSDGDLDLLVGSSMAAIILCVNTGTIYYPQWTDGCTDVLSSRDSEHQSIELCDVDGDLDLDLIIGTTETTTSGVYENLGDRWTPNWSPDMSLDTFGGTTLREYSGFSCVAGTGIVMSDYYLPVLSWWAFVGHPEPPSSLGATAGYAAATLAWDAAVDGGDAITEYIVESNVSTVDNITIAGATSARFDDLTTGEPIKFRVMSRNAYGDSPWSDWSNAVAPLLLYDVFVTRTTTATVVVEWGMASTVLGQVNVARITATPSDNSTAAVSAAVPLSDELAYSYTIDNLLTACTPYDVEVEVFEVGNGSISWTRTVSIEPPFGVCPQSCSEATSPEWVDPTGSDPFTVVCVGNYTVLAAATSLASDNTFSGDPLAFEPYSLSLTRKQALCDVSTDTVLVRSDSGASLTLDAPLLSAGSCTASSTTTDTSGTEITVNADDVVISSLLESAGSGMYNASTTLGDWVATSTPFQVYAAVQTTALNTRSVSGPDEYDSRVWNLTDLVIDVSCARANVELAVDGQEWASWSTATYNSTSETEHTVDARATMDPLPTEDTPATLSWTYDATPPRADITETRPSLFSSSTSATVGLSADETVASFTYCFDGVCATEAVSTVGVSDTTVLPSTELSGSLNNPLGADAVIAVTVTSDSGVLVQWSLDGANWINGNSTLQLSDLDAGWHSLLVRAVDADGNADASPVALALDVAQDHMPPDTRAESVPNAFISSSEATIVFSATESNCTFDYSLDLGLTWSTSSSAELYLSSLAVGAYAVMARAIDAAGNVDPTPELVSWQVVQAPVATLVLYPADVSPFASAAFAVDVAGGSQCSSTFDVRVSDGASVESGGVGSDGAFAVGPLDPDIYELTVETACELDANELVFSWEVAADDDLVTVSVDSLADGEHEVWTWATDLAGNVGGTSSVYGWTVDTLAPDTSAVGDAYVASSDVTFNASCDDSKGCTFLLGIDGVLQPDCCVAYNLTDGQYSVSVTAVDLAGNTDATPAEFVTIVDTTAPELNISAVNGTLTASPAFSASCEDVTTWCVSAEWFVNGTAVSARPSLPDGDYVVTAVASDAAENSASTSLGFTVDTTSPSTRIVDRPASFIANTTATFDVQCEDKHPSHVLFTVDGTQTDTFALTGIAQGNHSVVLQAVDGAGNVDESPVVTWFVVDTDAPVLMDPVTTYTAEGRAVTVLLSCNDSWPCTFDPQLPTELRWWWIDDGGTFVCNGTDGAYSVDVGLVDDAGNAGEPATLTVIFDSVAPAVDFTQLPDAISSNTSFELWLDVDDANPNACECWYLRSDHETETAVPCSPNAAVALVLADASETAVSLFAECDDIRGHTGLGEASWAIDRVAPVVELNWTATATNDPSLSFTFEVLDFSSVVATCQLFHSSSGLVLAMVTPCASPWNVEADQDDDYTVVVEAVDAVLLSASSSAGFSLDTVAPTLSVDAQPSGTLNIGTPATFNFRCISVGTGCDTDVVDDDDCELEFQIAGAAERSPAAAGADFSVETIAGTNQVTLYATDAAGNEASEAATWAGSDEVVQIVLTRVPASPNALDTAVLEWDVVNSTTSTADLTFSYRVDAGAWAELQQGVLTATVTVEEPAEVDVTHTCDIAVVGQESASVSTAWTVSQCARTKELQLVGNEGALVCESCPTGVSCLDGEGTIDDGYWWSYGKAEIRGDSTFYPCRVPEACNGNTSTGLCAVGYEGVMCDVCSDGYGRTLDLLCESCGSADNSTVVALLGVLFSVILAAVAAFVVKQSLDTSDALRVVSLIKIMANYFLMMGILEKMDLDWGSMLRTLYSWMGVASGGSLADVHLVNCVASIDTFDLYRVYFSVPLLLLAVPALALAVCFVVQRTNGVSEPSIWGHSPTFVYRQAVLVFTYFAYPVVVTNAFRVLHCENIDGEMLLAADYSKHCNGSEYDALFGTATFYTTAVALGVPFAIFWLMRLYRNGKDSSKFRVQFFFFFGEFKPEWYWWEMVVMARKVALGAIAVLLNNHAQNMQVYAGTWLLLVCFTSQITCLPHKDPLQRHLETAAQGAVLASLLFGQGMAFEGVTSGQYNTFATLALVLNVALLTVLMGVLLRELVTEAKTRVRTGAVSIPVPRKSMLLRARDQALSRWSSSPRAAEVELSAVGPGTEVINPVVQQLGGDDENGEGNREEQHPVPVPQVAVGRKSLVRWRAVNI